MKRLLIPCLGLLAVSSCREKVVTPASAAPAPPVASSPIRVYIHGQVAEPGMFDVSADPSIEAAFAMAGGWSGKGGGLDPDIPHPPPTFKLNRSGKLMQVPIVIDRQTRVVTVKDAEWKDFKLLDDDLITVPQMVF